MCYDVDNVKNILPLKDQWLSINSYKFINDEDVLVIKAVCNLHTSDQKTGPKSLPMYQVPELSIARSDFNSVLYDSNCGFLTVNRHLIVNSNSANQCCMTSFLIL